MRPAPWPSFRCYYSQWPSQGQLDKLLLMVFWARVSKGQDSNTTLSSETVAVHVVCFGRHYIVIRWLCRVDRHGHHLCL
jgi:hypothetical protein